MPTPGITVSAGDEPPLPSSHRALLLAGAVLVLAALAAYQNSLSVPFVFDDTRAVVDNPTIRSLWPIRPVLSPPAGLTVGGRPLVNLSLAINYALGGTDVRGYHALNLAIHVLAGLILFGLVRRTLRLRSGQALVAAERGRRTPPQDSDSAAYGDATLLALAIALLWTLHPLQTESVTYVVQRTESLMGLCYLLTLYAFVRGAESPRPDRWYALTIAACLAGMASKEVMVSAPLLVLLYDRTFVSDSLREAWRRRRGLYAGLAATWLVLAWLVIATGSRGGTAGFGAGVAWWAYALSQFHAIAHYLRLAVWPHPLVLDYGAPLARHASEVLPYGLLIVALVAATLVALRRRPALGFAGCWFFAILAPTSSVVPVATQTMAEHRMYLPLAAVVAIAVLGLHALAGRRGRPVFVALAAGLGFLTWQRNADYRSELAIWSDTAAKCPASPRAHFTLGNVLSRLDRLPEARRQYEDVLRLDPRHAEAHNSLGNVLVWMNRPAEALAHYARALELEPDYVETEYNWGNTLVQLDRLPEATPHYEHALRLDPDNAEVRNNFGNALLLAGRVPEAIRQYEAALRIKPAAAEAHYNLGNALVRAGRLSEAIRQYEEALRLKPDYGEAQANLVQARALQPATPPP